MVGVVEIINFKISSLKAMLRYSLGYDVTAGSTDSVVYTCSKVRRTPHGTVPAHHTWIDCPVLQCSNGALQKPLWLPLVEYARWMHTSHFGFTIESIQRRVLNQCHWLPVATQ